MEWQGVKNFAGGLTLGGGMLMLGGGIALLIPGLEPLGVAMIDAGFIGGSFGVVVGIGAMQNEQSGGNE